MLRISDHVVVRYLERVQGLNIYAVRKQIRKAVELGDRHPGASAVVSGGITYKIYDGVVVDCVRVKNRKKRRFAARAFKKGRQHGA